MTNNKGSGIFFPNLRLSTGNFGFAIRDLCEAALDKWTKGQKGSGVFFSHFIPPGRRKTSRNKDSRPLYFPFISFIFP